MIEGIKKILPEDVIITNFSLYDPASHSRVDQDELELQFTIDELRDVVEDAVFKPERMLSLMERQYPGLYEQDTAVWEGYSLRKHTLMVMNQFEKYYGCMNLPGDVDKSLFRLVLALHDIGKPKAIAIGDKKLQHKFTPQYVKKLLTSLLFSEKQIQLAVILTSNDPLGKYLTNQMGSSEARQTIEDMAKTIQMSFDDFFELLCIYYKVDAGSYTEDAGGFESLDYLFGFNLEDRRLDFSKDIQAKIDQLKYANYS